MEGVRSDENSYRSMVETILDCTIFLLDEDGRGVTRNPAAGRNVGYRADEIMGGHFSIFYPPESAQNGKPERDLIAAAGADGQFNDEGWRLRKDGSRFWAQLGVAPARNEARDIIGFVMLIQDLTEQKRTEIALSIDAADVYRPIDTATTCGQVVNELVTNSLKHAFPEGRHGHIAVGLTIDTNGNGVLSVSDDGIGIPNGVDVTHAVTPGLRLVNLLADQVGGALAVERVEPTRFTLKFPVESRRVARASGGKGMVACRFPLGRRAGVG